MMNIVKTSINYTMGDSNFDMIKKKTKKETKTKKFKSNI